MISKIALAAVVVAGVGVAPSAWAKTAYGDQMSPHHRVHHRHHVARYRNPAVATDAPQEQAAPADTTVPVPEVFYHASGDSSSH